MAGPVVKYVFVLLHIGSAAGWFGLSLRLTAQVRSVFNLGPDAAATLADDVERSVGLMDVSLMLTFVFALGAFFAGGGFSAYGVPYHVSLSLIVVLLGLQLLVIRKSWNQLKSSLSAPSSRGATSRRVSPSGRITSGLEARRRRHRRRIAIGTSGSEVIWLALLVLMFWDQFTAVF